MAETMPAMSSASQLDMKSGRGTSFDKQAVQGGNHDAAETSGMEKPANFHHRGSHKDESSMASRGPVGSQANGVRPLPKASVHVDWRLVLNELQREKKRAIARKEEQYSNRSLFILESSSRIREALIKVVEWPMFDRLVLLLIVCNCIFLMLDDPVCRCQRIPGTPNCVSSADMYKRLLFAAKHCDTWPGTDNFLEASEYIFTVLFTGELLIKIIARGLILHKHAFLRDQMNWLDFIVVIASLVSLTNPDTSFSFLRTIRVLRPLRTLTRIKQMRPLINTIIRSLYSLVNVVMLLFFFMLVYGILGIELLSNGLRGRCYVDPLNNEFPPGVVARLKSQQIPFIVEPMRTIGSWDPGIDICSTDASAEPCSPYSMDGVFYNTTCQVMRWCNTGWCTDANGWNENPYDFGGGYMSYDNFGQAMLTIFQVLTNEGWTDIMYLYEDGWNKWGSRFFHISWVILGSFFVIQLALAVLSHSFVQAQEEEKTAREREALHEEAILQVHERKQVAKQKLGMLEHVSTMSMANNTMGEVSSSRDYSNESITIVERFQLSYLFLTRIRNPKVLWLRDKVVAAFTRAQTMCRVVVSSSHFQNLIFAAIFLNTLCLAADFHDQNLYEESICKRRCELDSNLPAGAQEACRGPLFNRTWDMDGSGGSEKRPQLGNVYCFMDKHELVSESLVCADHTSAEECWSAHEDCHWFEDDSAQKCKRGMYNYSSIALERGKTISLRHLCGDTGLQCDAYPPTLARIIDMVNRILTFFFIAEMTLKVLGLGTKEYFADNYNKFDFAVVISSIVELILEARDGGEGGSKLSALRGMRLFRLFKLARSWKSMRKILTTMGIALGSLWPLTIVWVMFMYIFGLLGMQTVGARFKYVKADTPRSNFDFFWPSEVGHGAFVVTFQIITTENWNTILYNCITSVGIMSSLFPISIVIFGNYIIMNLFISILLQGFDEDDEFPDNDEPQLPKTGNTAMDRIRKMLGRSTARVLGRRSSDESPINEVMDKKGIEVLKDLSSFASGIVRHSPEDMVNFYGRKVPVSNHKAFGFISRTNPVRVIIAFIVRHAFFDYAILCCIFISSLTLMIERPADSIITQDNQCPAPPAFVDCRGLEPGQIQLVNCPQDAQDDDWNRVYGQCGSAEEHPCCQTKAMLETFVTMDQVFTIIFLIEMFFKMIADGVVLHGKSYFRDAWNWLDFIIVVVSMISTYGADDPTLANIKFFKSLRALRALRPLRVIKRNPGLKIVVVALLSSIPAMLNVAVVFLLWFSMYAMLGTQLFKGKLYSCMDHQNMLFYGTAFTPSGSLYTPTTVMSGKQAVPTIIECASRTQGLGTWDRKYYSFDYYHHGLLTLFEMATTEGWMDVMAATTDMTEVGVTPIPNFLPHAAWYSVLHIVVGAFVLLNLIVGSIINNYNRIKSTTEGIPPFLTPEQQEWKETRKLIVQLKPILRLEGPRNPFRRFLFDIANHPYFEWVTTSVIVANVLTMTLKTHDEHDCFTAVKVWINISFTIIFILEAVIKIIALGPRWYVRDGWNVFDFSVAILSCVSVGFDVSSKAYTCDPALKTGVTTDNVPALQVLRAFRIARVFRLVRRARGLRNMIQTLIVSIPALGNIMGLIGIFTIIFAVLGNTLFFNVSFDQDFYGRMDPNANYQSFDNAIFLLLRQTTGEVWNNVMYYCSERDLYRACGRTDPPYLGEGCGGPEIGPLFHLFWQLFGTYLMMQLFTAVIIENFDDVSKEDSSFMPVDRLNEFVDVWTELDPEAKQRIPSSSLPLLIMKLKPPLGINAPGNGRSNLLQVIKDLAIPIRGESVMYRDTFLACVKRVMAHDTEDDEDDEPEELDKTITGFNGQAVTIAEDFAARLVQRAYRDWREKRMQVQKGTGMTKSIPLSMENLPSRVVNW